MAGTDFSHLTTDELIKGINALDLPDYIRSKAYGIDVRETLAQMTEMTIQLGVNMGLSPDDAVKWARKLQESVSQSDFDSWVATLLDGGPSIFMNTLSELQTTYPNGAAGVALVRETDPAKIYVWNGTTWEDFGAYQGIEVKDGSITTSKLADSSVDRKKTSYYRLVDEKVDLTALGLESGGYYGSTAGSWVSSNEYATLSIQTSPGALFRREGAYSAAGSTATHVSFWDTNGAFISGTQSEDFVTPEDTNVAKLTIAHANISNGVANLYRVLATDVELTLVAENFDSSRSSNIIKRNNTDWYEVARNKVNFKVSGTITDGGYYGLDGAWSTGSGWSSIEIELNPSGVYDRENFSYSGASATFATFYDSEGNLVDATQDESFTVPDNAKLTRLAINTVKIPEAGLYEVRYVDPKLIVAAKNMTSNLRGLKWNALGDSITFGAGSSYSYVDIIENATGVIARNYGVSGTAISSVENASGVGMSVRYADMSDDADIITVFGGTNDMSLQVEIGTWESTSTETVYGATKSLVVGLYKKYPGKKIAFILPIPRWTVNGEHAHGLENYVDAIKDVCDRYSVPTLDLYRNSGLMPGVPEFQSVTMPDLTHPNETGHGIIATKIQRFLESL